VINSHYDSLVVFVLEPNSWHKECSNLSTGNQLMDQEQSLV